MDTTIVVYKGYVSVICLDVTLQRLVLVGSPIFDWLVSFRIIFSLLFLFKFADVLAQFKVCLVILTRCTVIYMHMEQKGASINTAMKI